MKEIVQAMGMMVAWSLSLAVCVQAEAAAKAHATKGKTQLSTQSAQPISLNIAAINNSGESGTVTLTPVGRNRTRVDINVVGENRTASQPASIHAGTCARLDPRPIWGLNDVREGRSATEIPIHLSRLTSGRYVISINRSKLQRNSRIACGDISTGHATSGVARIAPPGTTSR